VPGLSNYGIQQTDIADVVAKAMRASSMKGNPIELSEAELSATLAEAL